MELELHTIGVQVIYNIAASVVDNLPQAVEWTVELELHTIGVQVIYNIAASVVDNLPQAVEWTVELELHTIGVQIVDNIAASVVDNLPQAMEWTVELELHMIGVQVIDNIAVTSGARSAHDRCTSSFNEFPRIRRWRFIIITALRIHKCLVDSTSTSQMWHVSLSYFPTNCCQTSVMRLCPLRK